MTKQRINIAIDGYSSCGKGTLAKMLAKSLNYVFIDSGAMYRAVTLALLKNKIHVEDVPNIIQQLPEIEITFQSNPETNYYHTLLNGRDVESEIRSMEVSQLVSPVSKIKEVRTFLVAQQQAMGKRKGVVMDGRDIGTTVFPDAELKIFMTAKAEVRAMRRFEELKRNGIVNLSYEDVLANLNERDRIDSSRANSPLKPALDAIVIDNSELSKEEQFNQALALARKAIV